MLDPAMLMLDGGLFMYIIVMVGLLNAIGALVYAGLSLVWRLPAALVLGPLVVPALLGRSRGRRTGRDRSTRSTPSRRRARR